MKQGSISSPRPSSHERVIEEMAVMLVVLVLVGFSFSVGLADSAGD